MKIARTKTKHTTYGIQIIIAMICLAGSTHTLALDKIMVCIDPGGTGRIIPVEVGSQAAADAITKKEGNYIADEILGCEQTQSSDCPCNGIATGGDTWNADFIATTCDDYTPTPIYMRVRNYVAWNEQHALFVRLSADVNDPVYECGVLPPDYSLEAKYSPLSAEQVESCRIELQQIIENNGLTACKTENT